VLQLCVCGSVTGGGRCCGCVSLPNIPKIRKQQILCQPTAVIALSADSEPIFPHCVCVCMCEAVCVCVCECVCVCVCVDSKLLFPWLCVID